MNRQSISTHYHNAKDTPLMYTPFNQMLVFRQKKEKKKEKKKSNIGILSYTKLNHCKGNYP